MFNGVGIKVPNETKLTIKNVSLNLKDETERSEKPVIYEMNSNH